MQCTGCRLTLVEFRNKDVIVRKTGIGKHCLICHCAINPYGSSCLTGGFRLITAMSWLLAGAKRLHS